MYFEHGRNLNALDVLLDTADLAGLPTSAAEVVLTDRLWSPRVDEHWERSRRLGVTAVPTYRTGAGMVVGAQPYVVLGELLRWEEGR